MSFQLPRAAALGAALFGASGCGASDTTDPTPYAQSVESLELGEAAGYNLGLLPDIVLGPPQGKGTASGSLHVLSLGHGGEIVLGFGGQELVDEPGPDFVVFENPFWPGDEPSLVFAELGEVSVSEDGAVWHTFPCDTEGDGRGRFPGCAGWSPTLPYDAQALVPLDIELTGGDAFDLAELAVRSARFVRIRDLKTLPPAGNSGGFDLDAVGVVHGR
jgi:hypothetical protein